MFHPNPDLYKIDTKKGIQEYISSLEGLNKLISLRHEAYYKNKISLNWFLILGQWILDECGNTCKIIGDFIPREKIGGLEKVLTREEFRKELRTYDRIIKPNVLTDEEMEFLSMEDRKGRSYLTSISSSLGRPQIPPTHVKCALCGRKWTIKDCHDALDRHETNSFFDLGEFVGKTLTEVNQILSIKDDAEYFVQGELSNSKFIDLTPDEKYPNVVKNKYGNFTADNNHIIEQGDSAILNIWKFYHTKCNRINRAISEYKFFQDIFEKAGYKCFLTAIPNEYCSCEVCGPWFSVDSPTGKFKIGWRKRVINIEFGGLNLAELFSEEVVTKSKDYIHAWGKDKAIEYLSKIRESIWNSERA